MTKWNEMVQASFISGTKLPKEIVITNNNVTEVKEALSALRLVSDNISYLQNTLRQVDKDYEVAKIDMNIEKIRTLNSEAIIIHDLLEKSFEMTLNGLSMKEENETDIQAKERLEKLFKLPR